MLYVKPSEFVRQFAPWSISKLNVANQCPHRFYLQYSVKRKMGLPTTSEALVGRAVHTMLENIIKGHTLENSKLLAIDVHQLTTTEIETVDGFLPATTRFLAKVHTYQKKFNLGKLQPEQKWAIKLDGSSCGYWNNDGFLRGSIDLNALFQHKPYALLIDHKTGKWKALEEYAGQLAAYKLLFKAHHPEVQKIQIGINHLFTETIDMKKGLDDVRDVSTMLSTFIGYANNRTRTAYNHQVTRKGPLCGWCDYKTICPAHAEHNGSK